MGVAAISAYDEAVKKLTAEAQGLQRTKLVHPQAAVTDGFTNSSSLRLLKRVAGYTVPIYASHKSLVRND